MEIYNAKSDDLKGLLKIYTQLHENPMPEINSKILSLWQEILNDNLLKGGAYLCLTMNTVKSFINC